MCHEKCQYEIFKLSRVVVESRSMRAAWGRTQHLLHLMSDAPNIRSYRIAFIRSVNELYASISVKSLCPSRLELLQRPARWYASLARMLVWHTPS